MSLADGGFKSTDGRLRYLTAYNELRTLSARPDVVHDVPTKFGTVRVYQHGPDGGVPVVLIHGFFLTSAMWWEQVAPVRARHAAAWITGHAVTNSSIGRLTGLFVAGFAAFGPPYARRRWSFPVIICCAQCNSPSKFFWRATLFTIRRKRFKGSGRWCPRGDITCGPMRHTRCRPRFRTK